MLFEEHIILSFVQLPSKKNNTLCDTILTCTSIK